MEVHGDYKSKLVAEICSISSRTSSSCKIHRKSVINEQAAFIDWYLVLNVDEEVSTEAIKKRYHQLALQLHPDKNKHPKAEVAFKLVFEAYTCLSDKLRRKAFDDERNVPCKECKTRSVSEAFKFNNNGDGSRVNKNWPRYEIRPEMLQTVKEIRQKLQEEARVVENCLRKYHEPRRETPIFDPSDYLKISGYPHCRSQILNQNSLKYSLLNERNTTSYSEKKGRWETPVFEVRKRSATVKQ